MRSTSMKFISVRDLRTSPAQDGHHEQWTPNCTLDSNFRRNPGRYNKSDEESPGRHCDKKYTVPFREKREKQNNGQRDRGRNQAVTKRSIRMRIVLDTNVFVSGLLNPNGTPATILNLVVNAKVQLLYDNRILQEYIGVLRREKFCFNWESIEALIDYLQDEGEYISAEPTNKQFEDDDDRAFYEVMITGEADYLISGNLRHFPENNKIMDPREFVTEYKKRKKEK